MNKRFASVESSEYADYIRLLRGAASLSRLFSDGEIPYIAYRLAENIFCRSFSAHNLARSDVAFDAQIGSLGIGLKTFISPKGTGHKREKVAEFNTLSSELRALEGEELVRRLAHYRNERIQLARRLYGIDESLYHIVARAPGALYLFETDYETIDLDSIRLVKEKSDKSIPFEAGGHRYSFNYSKSTLFRDFEVPQSALCIEAEIWEEPYDLLLQLGSGHQLLAGAKRSERLGQDYVLLPLYSRRGGKSVPERSGLNQWNARGRERDLGEVYIPVPKAIHKRFPDFFPGRDVSFVLRTPRGEALQAKLCQDGAKALMTNPNKALSDWLLREVLRLEEGELLSYDHLLRMGFDSVYIRREGEGVYSIDIAPVGSYDGAMGIGKLDVEE